MSQRLFKNTGIFSYLALIVPPIPTKLVCEPE